MKKIRQTNHEKNLIQCGCEIITWDHEIIMGTLLKEFYKDEVNLILRAALDDSKRQYIYLTIDWDNYLNNRTNIRGQAVYDKKLRKFTHIQYSDRYNYAVNFSIASKVAFFGREWYNQLKHVFPFGCSVKNGIHYLRYAK